MSAWKRSSGFEPAAAAISSAKARMPSSDAVSGVSRRKTPAGHALDLVADQAVHVRGLDLALGRDHQAVERTLDGEGVDAVAERVGRGLEAAVAVDVDPPVDDELAVMAARREPENLDRAARRRCVAIGGLVEDPEAHRAALSGDTVRRWRRRAGHCRR